MSQLQFKGKQFVQNHHFAVKYHELVPKKDKSLTDKVSLHDNLIIHGDNLAALKALLPSYAGKVKCIYIDPPYNTGNENWVYNDNVSSPMMQEWLGKVVDRDDLTRHDKWLCMMTPRLKLLRELLRDDGVIFISIDDNEVHHLRMLMNEIFGEENFLVQIVWRKKKQISSDNKGFSSQIEYIVAYMKSNQFIPNKLAVSVEFSRRSFSNPNNDPNGPWQTVAITVSKGHQGGGYDYTITTPSDKKITRKWLYPERSYKKLEQDGRLYFGMDHSSIPRRIIYLSEVEGIVPSNLWLDMGTNRDGKLEVSEIFDSSIFETPKPSILIKQLLQIATEEDSIILDSFAGSGTTAQVVLALNKEDGGNRKFILVEMEDYADKITAERVRRVIKGVKNAKDKNLQKGLGGSFSYFELGKPIEMESILSGKNLPTYKELARYVFYTATGEEFNDKEINENSGFIGESRNYEVYLFYKPDIEYLKNTALTLDRAKALGKYKNKQRLVFAPTKYLDQDHLDEFHINFAQLPFEIYKLAA